MYHRITIEIISKQHSRDLFILWEEQFRHFCSNSSMYDCWKENTQDILNYITSHAENGQGIVAKMDDRLIGYFAYEVFEFHGAESAMIPFPGNAAILEDRDKIYTALYTALGKELVKKGIKNHYITSCYKDDHVTKALFDIGFGSYVMDAFVKPEVRDCAFGNDIMMERASDTDAKALYEIVRRSEVYYSYSPIFLKMDEISYHELCSLINQSNLFVAKDAGAIIGFMNLSVNRENDIFRMCVNGMGQIDEIGAFILEEYRNKNIGNQFLNTIFRYCKEQQIPCVHVDFETANLYANKFWRKHFEPVMLSLKRTVHADIS